jgi:hypothetical protein
MPRDTLSAGWDGPFSIQIGNSSGDWLLWLGLLLLAGAIILGRMLMSMGTLVYDSRGVDKETGKPIRSGAALDELQPVGLIRFTLMQSPQFRGQISRLAPRSLLLLSRWLSFDYLFMKLAYPALAILGWWLVDHPDIRSLHHWDASWRWAAILIPVMAWLADILENRTASKAIQETSTGLTATDPPVKKAALERGEEWARVMRAASVTKWVLVAVSVVIVLSLGIAALVRYPELR